MKNIRKQTVKSFFAYLGCIGMAFLVMYLINGTVGVLLITALCTALALSVISAVIVTRSVKIDLQTDKQVLFKKETLTCSVSMNKNFLIPAPMIEVYLDCSPQLSKEIHLCRATIAGRETNTINIPVTAKYSGRAKVGITQAFVCDYFGIFRFRIKKGILNDSVKISVYPDIPEVPVQTNFLKTAVLFSTDDNEEETNETALTPTGQPGYDHREYYPGDPIKRINWKMSSKKDIYMIRLDEKLAGGGQVFFLDVPQTEENDKNLSVRDRVIEGMLAVFTMLVREGRETVFFLADGDRWHKTDIRTPVDIHHIQQRLSDFTPNPALSVIPPEIFSTGKTPICFTSAVAETPQSAAAVVSEIPEIFLVCSSDSGIPHITSELWTISANFEIQKL